MNLPNGESLNEKRKDADELIREVLNKMPKEKKLEALRVLQGFNLCATAYDKKAGWGEEYVGKD